MKITGPKTIGGQNVHLEKKGKGRGKNKSNSKYDYGIIHKEFLYGFIYDSQKYNFYHFIASLGPILC